MPLKENLQQATALKLELDQLRPISPEMEKRIMQKFRLDWNYHSSNIEGNKLTYGETKALILFGQTAQAKPLMDHLQMSGHDEAIKSIEEVVKQERPLTENFIRELHKLILKEPYQVNAQTPDGKPTKKWISVGQYKTSPNHVLTDTGEMFYFASPEETPAKMDDLMNWYRTNLDNEDLHPVLFATEFHYRFIRIHPFDDGNGRIARLLMNFILMQKGFPPAIIKTEDKSNYFAALQQADAGELEYFFDYITIQVIRSLQLMIQGARGEEIEEEDDLDKKLQLLKIKLGEEPNSKVTIKKSSQAIRDVLKNSISPLIIALDKRLADFDTFFRTRTVFITSDNFRVPRTTFHNAFVDILNKKINKELDNKLVINYIHFESTFDGLRSSPKSFSIKGVKFVISFHENIYEISGTGLTQSLSFLYDKFLNEEEINSIVNKLGNWQYNILEEAVEKANK